MISRFRLLDRDLRSRRRSPCHVPARLPSVHRPWMAGGLALAILATLSLSAPAQEITRRQLAPGVLRVIPADPKTEETFDGPLEFVEVSKGISNLDWTPHFTPKSDTLLEKAKQVVFRHQVWNLEFAFKPLRMLRVDVPQPNGKLARKNVWYLVYRIRYLGGDLTPMAKEDRYGHTLFPTSEPVDGPSKRFFPHFVLRSHEYDKEYLDRLIPAAVQPIAARERIGDKLHNSVEITQVPIALSDESNDQSVWGVVTWEDIDPRIDYLSMYIRGLTNAYRFEASGDLKPGDPAASSRSFEYKTLKLNFWRPGDAVREHEQEIRFGVPVDENRQDELNNIYEQQESLDYKWIYR